MDIIGGENVSLLVSLSLFFRNKNHVTFVHNKTRSLSAVKFSPKKSYVAVVNNAAQGNDNDTLELCLNACCALCMMQNSMDSDPKGGKTPVCVQIT